MELVLGADIGGTSTRVVLLDRQGTVQGTGRAAGGNLRSSTPELVRERLASALADAWATVQDPTGIAAAHLGIAGAGAAGRNAAQAVVRAAWADAGLPDADVLRVGDDLVTAFAAGARSDDGALLLAGTGAVAARIESGAVVGRAGGLGWLLGDEGSGVWLGLHALRAAAHDLDRTGPATTLTRTVLEELGVDSDNPQQGLIAAAHAVPVAAHGRLAPLVTAAALDGDEVARGLIDKGIAALLRTVGAVLDGKSEVVLAGSLLTEDTPIRAGVLAGLSGRRVLTARVPLVGSLLLAARAAGWTVDPPAIESAVVTKVTNA